MSLPQTGEIKYVIWSPDHYPMEQNMYENIAATLNLSATEQADLIAAVQTAPIIETIKEEDGSERVVYGYTPESERALSTLISAFIKVINGVAKRGHGILPLEDAASTCMETFIRTVRTYDLTSEVPLHRVIGRIMSNTLSDTERTSDLVKVTEAVAQRYWRLLRQHDGDAVAAYLACKDKSNATGISPEVFLSAHNAMTIDSLDYNSGDADNSANPSKVTNTGSSANIAHEAFVAEVAPEDAVIQELTVKWLFSLVTPRQEQVIRVRFGFADPTTLSLVAAAGLSAGEVQTEKATAEACHLSTSTSGRALRDGIETMRDALRAAMAA